MGKVLDRIQKNRQGGQENTGQPLPRSRVLDRIQKNRTRTVESVAPAPEIVEPSLPSLPQAERPETPSFGRIFGGELKKAAGQVFGGFAKQVGKTTGSIFEGLFRGGRVALKTSIAPIATTIGSQVTGLPYSEVGRRYFNEEILPEIKAQKNLYRDFGTYQIKNFSVPTAKRVEDAVLNFTGNEQAARAAGTFVKYGSALGFSYIAITEPGNPAYFIPLKLPKVLTQKKTPIALTRNDLIEITRGKTISSEKQQLFKDLTTKGLSIKDLLKQSGGKEFSIQVIRPTKIGQFLGVVPARGIAPPSELPIPDILASAANLYQSIRYPQTVTTTPRSERRLLGRGKGQEQMASLVGNFKKQVTAQLEGTGMKDWAKTISKLELSGVQNAADLENRILLALPDDVPSPVLQAIQNWARSMEQLRFFGSIDQAVKQGIKTRIIPQPRIQTPAITPIPASIPQAAAQVVKQLTSTELSLADIARQTSSVQEFEQKIVSLPSNTPMRQAASTIKENELRTIIQEYIDTASERAGITNPVAYTARQIREKNAPAPIQAAAQTLGRQVLPREKVQLPGFPSEQSLQQIIDQPPKTQFANMQEFYDTVRSQELARTAEEERVQSLIPRPAVKTTGEAPVSVGEEKKPLIPKELEPLAQEARKYKTAEEFVKAQPKNKLGFAALDDIYKKPLLDNSSEKIQVYRGGGSGDLRLGDYVTTDKNRAGQYGVVQEFMIPRNQLRVADTEGKKIGLHTKNDLIYDNRSRLIDIWKRAQKKPLIPRPKPQAEAVKKAEDGKKYPTIHQGGKIKMVEGKSVKIIDGVKTFLHEGDGGWIVSEASTGRFISESRSKEGAIAKASFNIDEVGKEKFLELIKKHKITAQIPKSKPKTKATDGDFFIRREPQNAKINDEISPAKSPEELKTRIEQLNKFAQKNAILRRTGGISKRNAAGMFMRPRKFGVGEFIAKEGEIRMRGDYIKNDSDYVGVLAHELGHAIEYNTLGSTNENTLDVFGKNLSKETRDTILKELKTITLELEGAATIAEHPIYFNRPAELFARFLEKMIVSPGNLEEIAPTAKRLFEEQSIVHPMMREFIEAANNQIDKNFRKARFLPDLRQMYQNRLGKRVGNIVYDEEIVHRAMQERAKIVLTQFVAEKFKGVKDAPETLFRAAESIKITRGGKPEFGTRDFVMAKTKEEEKKLLESGLKIIDTQVEDGKAYPVFARQRYTPEEGKVIYEQLSPKGKQLVLDFTAQRSEAKDYFNREIVKDVNKIEGNIEGWVHHYFEEKPAIFGKRLKFMQKKAGTRQKRTGAEGYVEDFQKAMTKVLVDLESEKVFNDFITRQFSRVTKPIPEGAQPDPGWVEVVGSIRKGVGLKQEKKIIIVKDGRTFIPKQPRYQMPKEIYERYKLWKGLVDEATTAVKIVSDLNRYWRINVLTHLGTAGTNLISGGIQYSTKVLTDFYTETLTGKIAYPQTRRNLSAMLKVVLPKGWNDAPDWVYGADLSNFYGQFTKQPTMSKAISGYGDVALKAFGAYERYWKKIISLSENSRTLKGLEKVTKEGLQLPTKEERDLLAEINKQVDLYAYDYDNVPLWLEMHQKSVKGQLIKPFAKYPYKYAKHFTNMAGAVFDRTLPMQERLAKLLALSTIMGAFGFYANERRKKQQTPEGTEETPARISTRGRLLVGIAEDGKEVFARTAKYPFLNLTPFGSLLVNREWESSKDIISDIFGSLGPFFEIGLLALDYRSKYDQYESVPVLLGDSLSTFTPGFRILNDFSRMFDPYQRKQLTFLQTFTKLIPTTDEALREKLHGEVRTVKIPIEGGVEKTPDDKTKRTTIDSTLNNYWQDILLSSLTGIYLTRIDPKEAEAFQIREQKQVIKQFTLSEKERQDISPEESRKLSQEAYEAISGERERAEDNINQGKKTLEKLGNYAKGLTKDLGNTLKAIFTDEELRKITNNAVVFERQKDLGLLDLGDKTKEVDHIIPLSLGGGNSFDNLQAMDKPTKSKKDRVEQYLWGLLVGGGIDKQEAVRRIKNWEEEYKKISP